MSEKNKRTYPTAGTSKRNKRASPTAGWIGKEKKRTLLQEREKPETVMSHCPTVRKVSTWIRVDVRMCVFWQQKIATVKDDHRMYRGARWRGLFSLILYLMWQVVEQKEDLTEESQTVDRVYLESEGERNSCTA